MFYLTSFRQVYSTANSLLYLSGMPLKNVDHKWEKWERNRNFNVKSNTVHIVTVITVKKSLKKKNVVWLGFLLSCAALSILPVKSLDDDLLKVYIKKIYCYCLLHILWKHLKIHFSSANASKQFLTIILWPSVLSLNAKWWKWLIFLSF